MRLLRAALPHLRSTRPGTTASITASGTSNAPGRSSLHARPRPPLPPTPSIAHNAPHHSDASAAVLSPPPYLRYSAISSSYNTSAATDCQPQHSHDHVQSHTTTVTTNVPSLWPRGTWDDPVPIPSAAASRVVACTGPLCSSSSSSTPSSSYSPSGDATLHFSQPHPTVWITVEHNRPRQCPDCGQVFKLARRSGGHHSCADPLTTASS